MNNQLECLNDLLNVQRSTTQFFTTHHWPDSKTDEKFIKFYEELLSFSDENIQYGNISQGRLVLLQGLLDSFWLDPNHDITIFTARGKKVIPQLFHNLVKLTKDGIPLLDTANDRFLMFLCEKVPQDYYPRIAGITMIVFLNSTSKAIFLKPFIQKVFKKLQPNDPSNIPDLRLYLDRDYFIGKLKQTVLPNYTQTLTAMGILSKYQKTIYFSSHYFSWLITRSWYPTEFLSDNRKELKALNADQRKVLLARIIDTSKAHFSSSKTRDEYVKEIDSTYFDSPGLDKTEKRYWQLSNSEMQHTYKNLLINAHHYYSELMNRFIITKFYDSLRDIANDVSGQVRSEFWRGYASSSRIVSVMFAVNSQQKYQVISDLSLEERNVFNKRIIINYRDSDNEPAALILIFDNKIVVDIIQTAYSCQVYNSDNDYIQRVIERKVISEIRDLQLFKNSFLTSPINGEGKMDHRGDNWLMNFKNRLADYGIRPGNER